MDTHKIPQPGLAHYPVSPYRDRLGLVHGKLTPTDALEVRNHNLQRQLAEALRRNAELEQRVRDLQSVPRG